MSGLPGCCAMAWRAGRLAAGGARQLRTPRRRWPQCSVLSPSLISLFKAPRALTTCNACDTRSITLPRTMPGVLLPAAATLSLPRIKPGDTEVEVESWTTGEVVKLQLDAAKTPVQVRTPCIPPSFCPAPCSTWLFTARLQCCAVKFEIFVQTALCCIPPPGCDTKALAHHLAEHPMSHPTTVTPRNTYPLALCPPLCQLNIVCNIIQRCVPDCNHATSPLQHK